MPSALPLGFDARMASMTISLNGATLEARASGSLFWPSESLLVVSDMHLGKSDRLARQGRTLLPPYESIETLSRLADDLDATEARNVVCLGDSFDDLPAQTSLPAAARDTLDRLMAGRRWIWIEGNHDPGPLDLGGTHLGQLRLGPLVFRHIAQQGARPGEVSGHYHPKASLRTRVGQVARPAFLLDATRLIMPAYGRYTGGLRHIDPALRGLMADDATAILTGLRPIAAPAFAGAA